VEKNRCGWCEKDDLYRKYHDEEWGRSVAIGMVNEWVQLVFRALLCDDQ